MSTIVSLIDRRPRRSSVLCDPLGVRFPQLFRVTCDPARVDDPAGRALAGDGAWVAYTIGTPLSQIIKPLRPACTATPIQRLVPGRDWPSVVVRHHASYALATGYADAMTDAGIPETQLDIVFLENEIYTILVSHTPPVRRERSRMLRRRRPRGVRALGALCAARRRLSHGARRRPHEESTAWPTTYASTRSW